MITYSGVHIQKVGGADGTPTAVDIAVHSGRLCRFGGAVWEPLLTHQVFVGLLAWRRSQSTVNMIAGFIHDAHECVTGDVPRPFKCDCLRAEQNALDERIFPQFIPDGFDEVDHDLIKQCDYDACDIEATILGVPDFGNIEIAHSQCRTREHIYSDGPDLTLFRQLIRSPFYNGTIFGLKSLGVAEFAGVLEDAERCEYHMPPTIAGWGIV